MQTIDDQGVLLTFSTGVPGKGHGFCKLNISVLTDEEYTFIINKLIEDHLTSIIKEIDYDIRLVWDVFKKSKGIKTKVEIYLKNKMWSRDELLEENITLNTDMESIQAKLNQTVLELDFRAVKFLFFPRRDLNSHHWYTAAPFA